MRELSARRLQAIRELSPRKAVLLIDVDIRKRSLAQTAEEFGVSRKIARKEIEEAREEVEERLGGSSSE